MRISDWSSDVCSSDLGRIPALSTRACQRLRRQVLALRVHDALAAGASIRDVGIMLFGFERVRDEWADEALKSHCRRLIALAREMVAGGYRTLRSEEHTSELQSLMRISYAVFCLNKK